MGTSQIGKYLAAGHNWQIDQREVYMSWPWAKFFQVQPSHTVKKENTNIFIWSLLEFWSCNNNVIKILQHILKQTKPTFWQISRIKYFKKQVFDCDQCLTAFMTSWPEMHIWAHNTEKACNFTRSIISWKAAQ